MEYWGKMFYPSVNVHKEKYGSYYDKTLWEHILISVKYYLLMTFTLGLAYPWALVMKYKSLYHHHIICGKRLRFIGQPAELLPLWLWWWVLTVGTLGFYSFVVKLHMQQWIGANIIFEDV